MRLVPPVPPSLMSCLSSIPVCVACFLYWESLTRGENEMRHRPQP